MRATRDFSIPITSLTMCSGKPYSFMAVGNSLYFIFTEAEHELATFIIMADIILTTHNDTILLCKISRQGDKLAIIVFHAQVNINDPKKTDEEYYLKLYTVLWQSGKPSALEVIHNIEVKSEPTTLDLTEDSAFVSVSCKDGKVFRYDFEHGTEMEEAVEHAMLWCGDGLITSTAMKAVTALWGENNRVTKMVRLTNDCICIGDERGIITQIKMHPSGEFKEIERIYTPHLSNIGLMSLSNDKRQLLTYSTTDRAIFIWNILRSEPHRPIHLLETASVHSKPSSHT